MVAPTGGEPTEIEVPGLSGRGQEAYLSPAFQKGELFWNTRFSPDARWIVFQVEGTQIATAVPFSSRTEGTCR